ncbi:hypothetical protein X975_06498, partial [Stegodyphus mimosarum]
MSRCSVHFLPILSYPTNQQVAHSINQQLSLASNNPTTAQAIRCTQINLQRAEVATAQLIQHATEHSVDFMMIQEPYCRKGCIASFPIAWKVSQSKARNQDQEPRARFICCKSAWNPLLIKQDRDFVAILIVLRNTQMIFISAYSSPTDSIDNFVTNATHVCPSTPQVYGCDFNAHHVNWGYQDITPKGQALEDYLTANDLHLVNTSDAPLTFDNTYCKGLPDVTLATGTALSQVQDWKVSDELSCSDHRYITFTINCDINSYILKRFKLPKDKIRPLTAAFSTLLTAEEEALEAYNGKDDMEEFTAHLLNNFTTICSHLLPTRAVKKLHSISCWSKELRQQRQKCRALRRRIRTANDKDTKLHYLSVFRKERAVYKKIFLVAKIASWKTFCTQNSNPYSFLHKLSTNKIYQPSQIFAHPSLTDIAGDTAATYLDALFLKDDPAQDTIEQKTIRADTGLQATPADEAFTAISAADNLPLELINPPPMLCALSWRIYNQVRQPSHCIHLTGPPECL